MTSHAPREREPRTGLRSARPTGQPATDGRPRRRTMSISRPRTTNASIIARPRTVRGWRQAEARRHDDRQCDRGQHRRASGGARSHGRTERHGSVDPFRSSTHGRAIPATNRPKASQPREESRPDASTSLHSTPLRRPRVAADTTAATACCNSPSPATTRSGVSGSS